MKKKVLSLLIIVSMLFSITSLTVLAANKDTDQITKTTTSNSAPTQEGKNQTQKNLNLDKTKTIQKLNTMSKGKLKLREKDGQIFISGKLSYKKTPGKQSAINFLEENKNLFKIDDISKDLQPIEVKKEKTGDTFIKFQQVINGVKTEGNQLNVHFDKNGIIVSVNGNLEENKTITRLGKNKISQNQAVKIAKSLFDYKSLRHTPTVEKIIFTQDNKNYEVYKVNISYLEPTIENYDVYIEAYSGKVLQKESNIRSDGPTTGTGIDVQGKERNLDLYLNKNLYQMKNIVNPATNNILTYTLNHGTQYGYLVENSTNFFGLEDHKASVSAHYYADKVVDFYKNLFNRNSIDNNKMPIRSFTHYDRNYNNAFWSGNEMVYGDGDGVNFTYLSGDLDVVGHEMTHGVIQHSADLYYHNQSGALNESIADVFGVLISTYDKYNVASGGNWKFNEQDWVVGDDIYTPNIPGDALRSLSNPTLYGQPDHMNNYRNLPDTEDGDNGGVHINSGIPNKAAYLIAKEIGMKKTAQIYYWALTNYMNMYTDFEQAYHSLEQSAIDLYGEGSAEVGAIKNSFASVGIAENETMQMQPFKDITLDYWAYEYIEDLANRGIIKGYEDGTFRPNNPLTRAQTAKMIVIASGIDYESYEGKETGFKDVAKDNWAGKYIKAAKEAGIIKGYEDQFKPNDKVTRAQIAKMISIAFNLKKSGEPVHFKDIPNNHWAKEYIDILSSNDIISGYENGKYGPNDSTTRAQFSKILSEILKK